MITVQTRNYISAVNNKGYTRSTFNNYVEQCDGIDKLKKKDLDEIIRQLPSDYTINDVVFMDIYRLVSANETGRIINRWTWIAGSASVLSLVVSVISLCISIITLARSTPP